MPLFTAAFVPAAGLTQSPAAALAQALRMQELVPALCFFFLTSCVDCPERSAHPGAHFLAGGKNQAEPENANQRA